MAWSDLTIAIVGGDQREQEIARLAAATGAEVRAFGFPWPEEGIPGVKHATDPTSALSGVQVALFPIPGIADDGSLFAPDAPEPIIPDERLLRAMTPGAHVILGRADRGLRAAAELAGVHLVEYEDDQELMLLRAPAVVEGALKLTIEGTRITIHGARAVVVGYGNIGSLLAHTLGRLGARAVVAARNPVQRARALTVGLEAATLDDLPELAPTQDMLFSTVPVRVVAENVLRALKPGSFVMDLAAPPGGVDLELARALGHTAVWARGMGSRAPVTVGRSQWMGIEMRLCDIFGGRP